MPILGIWASSFKANIDSGSYFPIGEFTLASAQANIEFTNIPQTYTHLQIRALSTSSGSDNGLYMTFNGDTASNYTTHYLYGNGTTAGAGADRPRSSMYIGTNRYAVSSNIGFGGTIVDILDYKNTNKYTTIRSLDGNDRNGAGSVWFFSGLWMNTNAISSLKITSETNLAANSSFALYGVLA
jgi:hypothetical protein